jgi:hypothetical protein
MDNILLNQLIKAHKQHGKIIVGVDFDDTVFPFNKDEGNVKRCARVVELLKNNRDVITICLFSVADKQSLVYKEHIMDLYGIKPDYINESPIVKWGVCNKPYFNIQLDDKAGLNEALETISYFFQYVDNQYNKLKI